ncbi:MAG TPA: hypothetical protein VK694_07795 [Verrucomicrobiae bacterium]|nr:hypothetical protein [Verrucomicrobiae bacterium]
MPKVPLVTRLNQKGFSSVEALLAAVVFGLLVTALAGAIVYGRGSSASAGERVRANQLAEEGVEAARNIRDAGYTNLVDGTYGLVQGGNVWTLSGNSDTSGIFTRQVVVASAGANRKNITATVSWPQGTATASTSVVTRLTNWFAITQSWANLVLAGSYNAASTQDAVKVATSGDYAYVVRNDAAPDFMVVNISNPAAPTLAGSLSLSGAPTNVFVSGNYAYVTTSDDVAELRIINISNPAAPVIAGTYNATGAANGLGVYVVGNTAYLSRAANASSDEFVLVNVTTPASPTRIGGLANNISMYEVYVSGTVAYLATLSDTAEVLVVNIATPATPVLGTSLNLTGTTDALTIDGFGTNLLVGQGTTLYTLSIAAPLVPTQLGTVTASGTIYDVADNGSSRAFIGTNGALAPFQTVNLNTIASPVIDKSYAATLLTFYGVAYNATKDRVIAATNSDTQEVMVLAPN